MPGSTLFKAFVLFVALWAPVTQADSGWQPVQETIRKSEKDTRQYQAIRAWQSVLARVGEVLPAGLPFWCSLAVDEENICWDELVLVLPGETMPELDIFASINRIIVAPERLQEPGYRGRNWWDVDTGAVALEQFKRNIS